ncbi:MAG: YifB family Mg chelatase-like AAA ATPase [Coriobacteriia bacterium]|nr:YifB family Mg chelatase-like AAA ATPase [Coriobacteriia bacterium]
MSNTESGRYSILSATLRGVQAIPVDVEVSVYFGMPSFNIVGMPDTSIQESKERIRSAIKASGFTMPDTRIVANLAPGSIRKSGSGFDLPIAVAILAATKQIEIRGNNLIVGELALDGSIRDVPGILAHLRCAKSCKSNLLSPPSDSVYMEGVEQLSVSHLRDFLSNDFKITKFKKTENKNYDLDFSDINGHDMAKRAMQISACGNHGILMVGPPGSGKSMLASRMPSILPPLSEEEKMESAVIHSVAGADMSDVLNGIRPFRSPHHSATLAGLIGGGQPAKPGEVSLAHNGVLYMDELAEFNPHVLQGIRQPMETGSVSITRSDGVVNFPAKFSLIAASNPCPCGYYGDSQYECKCSPRQIQNYQSKIGGPVLDRIDMHLDISRIDASQVLSTGGGTSSDELRVGVNSGIEFRKWRSRHDIDNQNKNVGSEVLDKKCRGFKSKSGAMSRLVNSCKLSDSDFRFFEEASSKNNMSGRGIMRVLSVARTIADIEQKEKVNHDHLCEALAYRLREHL